MRAALRWSRKTQHWEAFRRRILDPIVYQSSPPEYAALATTIGLSSTAQAIAYVDVVKKRLLAVLRQTVVETVAGGDEEPEYEYLLSLLTQ